MKKSLNHFLTVLFAVISVGYVFPIVLVVLNSFKEKTSIALTPFVIPKGDKFVGFDNYINGVEKIGFFQHFGTSLFITVLSVATILLLSSMCAWYIIRVQTLFTKALYYVFIFSMIVPFQMVMFTLAKITDMLHLNNPIGIIVVYLGFGAGLSVFLFCGFIKGVPLAIEEAAMIDGCSPLETFFKIVMPVLKPTYVSVAILQAMWIWNDYLLPYLVLDIKRYKTVPIVIQYLRGGYGRVDMGAIMACLVLAILPIIILYVVCQKYIIEGVAAGAVKG